MSLRRGAGPTFLRALLALTVFLATIAAPSWASAHARGKHHAHHKHKRTDPVLASGTSLFGVPWKASATRSGLIQFSVDSRETFQRGRLEQLSLPSSPPSVFTAQTDTLVDPRPEGELAGVTSPSVVLLDVHMSDGSIWEIYPTAPSAAAQSRVPSLSQVRIFAGFFPSGAVPQTI